MTVELYPNAELSVTNASGDPADLRDNDTADGYEPDDADDDWDVRVGMDNPEDDLDGQQTTRFYFSPFNNTDAEAFVFLYEDGTQIDELLSEYVLDSGDEEVSVTWDAVDVTDADAVEFLVEIGPGGGMPGDRANSDLLYITWDSEQQETVDEEAASATITDTESVTASADTAPIPTDGLVGWYDASELDLNDSDPVATWTDESDEENDAEQSDTSQQPTYRADGFPNEASVEFAGDSEHLVVDWDDGIDVPEHTVFVLFRTDMDSGDDDIGAVVSKNDGADNRNYWFAIDNGQGFAGGDGQLGYRISTEGESADPTNLETGQDHRDNEPYIATGQNDPNDEQSLWIDGTTADSNASEGDAEGDGEPIYIGTERGLVGDRDFVGHIGAIITYDRALDSSERQTVEAYLNETFVGEADGEAVSATVSETETVSAATNTAAPTTASISEPETVTAASAAAEPATVTSADLSTVSAAARVSQPASTTLRETETITATGATAVSATATLRETEGVSATGTAAGSAAASLSDTESITTTPTVGQASTATIAGTETSTAEPRIAQAASTTFVETELISASASTEDQAPASATITETEQISATASTAQPAAATISEFEGITALGLTAQSASSPLRETELISASASTEDAKPAASASTETETISASASVAEPASLTITDTESVTGPARTAESAAIAITDADTMTASPLAAHAIGASISETESIAAAHTVAQPASVSSVETETITAIITDPEAVAITSSVQLEGTLSLQRDLEGTLHRARFLEGTLSLQWDLEGTLHRTRFLEGALHRTRFLEGAITGDNTNE